jgi:hypothetical protein
MFFKSRLVLFYFELNSCLKKLFFRYAFHQDVTPRSPDCRFQSDRRQQRKRQRRRKSQSSGQLREDRDQGNDESGNDS